MTAPWPSTLAAVLMSLGPGLVWLDYLRRLNPGRPESWARVGLVFGLGALSTQAVLFTTDAAGQLFPSATHPGPSPLDLLFYFVVWVGLVEETFKLLAVRLSVYRRFQEPSQGLMFAGVAALGFATAENAVYILRLEEPSVLLQRWILSTFGHVLMAMFWGYALGVTRTGPLEERRPALVLRGLALSAAVHGLFNWFLMQGWSLAAVLLLAILWRLFLARTRHAARLSPLRRIPRRAMRECPACRALVRRDATWCTACGKSLPQEMEAFCPACLGAVGVRGDCPHCGAGLVRGGDPGG